MLCHRLQGEQGTGKINGKNPLVVIALDINDGRCGKQRGVINENINGPQLTDCLGNACVNAVLSGYIHRYRDGTVTYFTGRLLRCLQIDVCNTHFRALQYIGVRKRFAYASGGARD